MHDSPPEGPGYSAESNRPDSFWEHHQPLFSVVPACYKVREYLPDFLASLDEQDVDKQRCELIFVIDGCPERSGDVVREWMALTDYPVRLVEKDNGGVASARNLGFGMARGSWIMTPDPDDTLAPDYLSQLHRAIEAHPDESMFASRLYTVDADGTHLPHPLDYRFNGAEDRVVDLQQDPEWLHLSGGTSVWSRGVIERARLEFDELLRTGSDSDFNLKYLIENGARYVVVPQAIYRYLKRADQSSIIGRAGKSYGRYEMTITHSHPRLLDRAGDECPQWLANALLYAVYHLFRGNRRQNSPVYALPSAQRARIAAALRANLGRIGRDSIMGFRVVDLPTEIRFAWLSAVGPITDSPVLRRSSDEVRGRKRVAFFSTQQRISFTVSTSEQRHPAWSEKTRGVEFLGETWCYEHLIWVHASAAESIRVRSRTFGLCFEFDGRALTERGYLERRELAAPALAAPTPDAAQAARVPEPATSVADVPDASGAVASALDPESEVFPPPLWIVDDGAGSRNTLPLYDRLRTRRPTASIWIVGDAARVDELRGSEPTQRRVTLRGSAEHLKLMRECAWLVTSDARWERTNQFDGVTIRKTWRTLYLPSEVDPFPDYRVLNGAKLDAAVVSSRYELEKLTAAGSPYSIDSGDVFVTGFPYQDRLHELAAAGPPMQTLLVAPAPRRDWPDPENGELDGYFGATEYLKQWRELLRDARLDELRRRTGYRVALAVPSGYEALVPLLEPPEWVQIVRSGGDAEEAVATSALCVTDYSPLALDAAFCGARTIFFQFDRSTEERDSVLSQASTLDFDDARLGPVVTTVDEALAAAALVSGIDHDRADADAAPFFYWRDGHATDRLLLLLDGVPDEAGHPIVRSQDPSWRPPVSLVIRCGSDINRLKRTLDSCTREALGDDFGTTLVVDQDDDEMRGYVTEFVSTHAGSASIVMSSGGDVPSADSASHAPRADAWHCFVQPGTVFLPGAIDRLARTAALRPDLAVVAGYPEHSRRNPFVVRKDIAQHQVSPKGQSVVDLNDSPDAFALAGVCAFVRTDLLDHRQDHNVPELRLWSAVLRGVRSSGMRIGILTGAVRVAGGTTAGLSIMRRRGADRAGVVDGVLRILESEIPGEDPLDAATSGMVMFLALQAMRYFKDSLWADPGELEERRRVLAAVLERVPADLLARSSWAPRLAGRYALCSLAGTRPQPWEVSSRRGPGKLIYDGMVVARLAALGVTVMGAEVTPAGAVIEALFMAYETPDVDLVLVGPQGRLLRAVESEPEKAFMFDRHGLFISSAASYRRFQIPIGAGEAGWTLSILNMRTGRADPCTHISDGVRSPFAESHDYLSRFNRYGAVRLRDRRTLVVSSPPPQRPRYSLSTVRRLRQHSGRLVLDRLVVRDKKDILLITDRPNFGDDNGEALFRYIQRERPDLRNKTWFVLDPSAPSYAELKRTGRVAHPRSRRHRWLYLNARLLFSSHLGDLYNNPFYGEPREYYTDATDFTFIWLQHGITMNGVDAVFSRFPRGQDGVVLGARHEIPYAATPKFGLTSQRLLETGFPRFDLLHEDRSTTSPVLLYMPTWRSWLTGARQADGTSAALDHFEQEEYYAHQRAFLTSGRVHDALRRANARIEMVLHPAMATYAEHYASLASDRVIIHKPGTVRYRDAFARGSALLTDYSSVFFDFAYLNKPVLFDHTDRARFRAEHYRDGIFDYDTAAPGPVLRSLDELVEAVCDLAASNFVSSDRYANSLDDVFLYRDRRNSERVMDRALELDAWRRAGGGTP